MLKSVTFTPPLKVQLPRADKHNMARKPETQDPSTTPLCIEFKSIAYQKINQLPGVPLAQITLRLYKS